MDEEFARCSNQFYEDRILYSAKYDRNEEKNLNAVEIKVKSSSIGRFSTKIKDKNMKFSQLISMKQ